MWNWEAGGGNGATDSRDAPRLLLIDDDETDREIIGRHLRRIFGDDLRFDMVADWDEALEAVRAGAHDIYLVDHFLGGGTGIGLIDATQADTHERAFILLTGQENRTVDLEATRVGAADYLVKSGLDVSRLERSLRYAWETLKQRRLLVDQATELRQAKAGIAEDAGNISSWRARCARCRPISARPWSGRKTARSSIAGWLSTTC